MIIGPVLEKLLLSPVETPSAREKQALHRAFLWDYRNNRPSDRLMGISLFGRHGFQRGLAMHRSLDEHCSKSIVTDRLTDRIKKFSLKGPFSAYTGREITHSEACMTLVVWPKNWRRMFVGEHGGVPLDALLIALVANGCSVPMTWEKIFAVSDGLVTSSPGFTSEWPIVSCPA